jgi:hypothetical protein
MSVDAIRPCIADLLTAQPQRVPPDEAEAAVRHAMRDEIDDLKISWQVIQARETGHIGIVMVEHICSLADYGSCARGRHGYMTRCVGPLTREVHEAQERRIERMPALMSEISRQMADSVARLKMQPTLAP